MILTNKLKIFDYNLLKEVIKLLTNRDRDYYEAPLSFLKRCYCKWLIYGPYFYKADLLPLYSFVNWNPMWIIFDNIIISSSIYIARWDLIMRDCHLRQILRFLFVFVLALFSMC